MAKPKYRLQVVENMRATAKSQAAEFVALCRQKLADEERELVRRKDLVVEMQERQQEEQEQMFLKIQTGFIAGDMMAHKDYMLKLKDEENKRQQQVENQQLIVEKAKQEVDKALVKLTEASKELKVLETHHEKWTANVKKEAERKEEKMNDEIGANLYQRRRVKENKR
jgi:flagellar biosynthesis chaperone FliJ